MKMLYYFNELLENGLSKYQVEKKVKNKELYKIARGIYSDEELPNDLSVIVKKYPKAYFHTDITQSIGKEKIDLTNVDLASLSAQKFYGMKGIGILIKKENIVIEPLIHGGKSTTKDRSGTPATPLIVSTSKALRLAYENLEEKQKKVKELNTYLREKLEQENITINSPEDATPYILNISIENIKPETMLHALEEKEIYISTKTACSTAEESKAVLSLTKDSLKASRSLRISISYKTTKEELNVFIKELINARNELNKLYVKKD